MALNLARSFEWHNRRNAIRFFILTDLPTSVPPDLTRTTVIHMAKGSLARGFSAKLHLDKLAPSTRSLFIDADCLVLGPLEPLISAFDGRSVGVLGELMHDGEWFGDVTAVRRRLNLSHLLKFNGGVVYVTRSEEARAIYEYARELEAQYDEIGFVRLRGQPNDEMLMSASLAKHGVMPVRNAGEYYADFQWWPELREFDVLNGRCLMVNPPVPDSRHQTRYPATDAHPVILHFLGHHVNTPEYLRASISLRYRHLFVADLLAAIGSAHSFGIRALKDVCRPVFRRFCGTRPIPQSKSRLVIDARDSTEPSLHEDCGEDRAH
jgi:hypothetical protein